MLEPVRSYDQKILRFNILFRAHKRESRELQVGKVSPQSRRIVELLTAGLLAFAAILRL